MPARKCGRARFSDPGMIRKYGGNYEKANEEYNLNCCDDSCRHGGYINSVSADVPNR